MIFGIILLLLGEPVPEETFTHSHLSWSSAILYQLPLSTTIHSILPVQFTFPTVFLHNLCPSPLWSTSWSSILHPSLNHCLLSATHAHINATCFAVVPRLCHLFQLSLNSLLWTLFFTLMPHIHLTILISACWSATYARQHSYGAYMPWQFRLSVHPSVCHTGGSVKNGWS